MKISWIMAAIVSLLTPLGLIAAQEPAAPARGQGGRGGAAATWWVEKSEGGVYVPPMKPLWKISDLKKKYAGRNNWREQVVLDPETDATYNSAAPASKFVRRMHPDTPTMYVVTAGEMRFDVQGQGIVNAKRGSIVNVLKGLIVSYEATGTQNALWVEIHPRNYKMVYPGEDTPPAPAAGHRMTKVSFNRGPAEYTAPNQVHWNLFDAIATCSNIGGAKVNVDHMYSQVNFGYADPNDPLNTCPPATRGGGPARGGDAGAAGRAGGGGRGGAARGAATPEAPFNPKSVFGHLHAGPAEWWVVQSGHIRARFENIGELIAEEGDVLYAAPMTWHQMGYVGPGPSCRLIISAYPILNMGNTEAADPAGQ